MIKKLAWISVTALSLMALSAQAEGMKCGAGKCGGAMKVEAKPEMGNKSGMSQKGQHKRKQSPFLIKRGLPHYTKMLMKNWDDPALALTKAQKAQLLDVRKETIGAVMRLKPEILKLEKEIVQAAKSGTSADQLKNRVDQLASFEAEATMAHLKCIEKTEAILKPEQIQYLMEKRKAHRMLKKQKMKEGAMKCGAGKCAGGK